MAAQKGINRVDHPRDRHVAKSNNNIKYLEKFAPLLAGSLSELSRLFRCKT